MSGRARSPCRNKHGVHGISKDDAMTDPALVAVAASALELVRDGMRVGLGTGHAALAFLVRLADRVRSGLRVVGVPTSEATAAEARRLGIPLGALDDDELAL